MTGDITDAGRARTSADAERTRVTRRGFLGSAAAGATAVGAGVAATGDASAQAQTYRFGGEVAAWRGRQPSAIEGAENPTLELEAGQQYEVVWENLDGQPHDFTIQTADGTTLAATDLVQEEGATASLTFTAAPEMAQYICTVHPTTMVGEISVSGGAAGGGQGVGLPLWPLLMVGALVAMFLSPLLFALFLFTRPHERGESTAR